MIWAWVFFSSDTKDLLEHIFWRQTFVIEYYQKKGLNFSQLFYSHKSNTDYINCNYATFYASTERFVIYGCNIFYSRSTKHSFCYNKGYHTPDIISLTWCTYQLINLQINKIVSSWTDMLSFLLITTTMHGFWH